MGSDKTSSEIQKWSESASISSPYLVLMSLYFKVQSLSVMLPHNCASGDVPHRSDDSRDACRWRACTLAALARLQV